jgi:hypothetical protein
MKKQHNQRLQTILLAAITTIFLLGAFNSISAQNATKFKVGDRVDGNYGPGTVLEVGSREHEGMLRVRLDKNPEESFQPYWLPASVYTLLDANDKPVADDKAVPQEKTTKTDAKNDEPATADNGNGEFKVGDRVKVNHAGLKGDEHLQPCTITRSLKNNSYGIRCDPWGGLSYMDYGALPEWIHPWADAPAAPTLECSFDAPAGTVSKTSTPSAQLFKRVVYERMAEYVKTQYGAKVQFGLQFTTFQLGTPFKNVMTGKGLLRDSVPQNAMFYPVKAQYKECREVPNGDYNRYRVTRMNFGCYKDRFGDWVCGTDSTPEFLEQQDVPKKQ